LKVDNLLAQYLYKYKRLSLEAIGIFNLDDTAVFPDENAKVKTQIEGVSFVSDSSAKLDDSLIEFIKSETGKMKSLAQADLDSYTTNAHEFLNIGKPFYFEGIGSLQKNKDGSFSFHAGTAIPLKTEQQTEKSPDLPKRKSVYAESNNRSSFNAGKLLVALGVLATIGLIVWGSYYLYNRNTNPDTSVKDNTTHVAADTVVSKPIAPDTSNANVPPATKKDSLPANNVKPSTSNVPAASTPATTGTGFKYILETTTKKVRALSRYNQIKDMDLLKSYHSKILLETKDSAVFKIYTIIPCSSSDTAKIRDSLNAWYYGGGKKKVIIEN
jgi:hypothetical protein